MVNLLVWVGEFEYIGKRAAKFSCHVMRKEWLKNLIITGIKESSRGRRRPKETYSNIFNLKKSFD